DRPGNGRVGRLVGDCCLDDEDTLEVRPDAETGELTQTERWVTQRCQDEQVASLDLHQCRRPHSIDALAAVPHLSLDVISIVQPSAAARPGYGIAVLPSTLPADAQPHFLSDASASALLDLARGVETDNCIGCPLAQQFGGQDRAVGRGAAADV